MRKWPYHFICLDCGSKIYKLTKRGFLNYFGRCCPKCSWPGKALGRLIPMDPPKEVAAYQPKHLISAIDRRTATLIAERRGLRSKEWIWIPRDAALRNKAIAGRSIPNESYLVGGFSDREKRHLLLKRTCRANH